MKIMTTETLPLTKEGNMKIKNQDDFNQGFAIGCIIAPTVFFAIIGVVYTIRWLLY